MKQMIVAVALATGLLAALPAAQAQGVVRGANEGAAAGDRVGGTVGGVVGGVVGGAVGGATGIVNGVLGADTRPRFREYVVRERRPSYTYREDVRVGAVLPDSGVSYYDVPDEYGARDYRYTVVNGRYVLVDPSSRRVVEIID